MLEILAPYSLLADELTCRLGGIACEPAAGDKFSRLSQPHLPKLCLPKLWRGIDRGTHAALQQSLLLGYPAPLQLANMSTSALNAEDTDNSEQVGSDRGPPLTAPDAFAGRASLRRQR
jgi:hypothetical protein